jgi:hypothetical protein
MKHILTGAMGAIALTVAAGAAQAGTLMTFNFSGTNNFGAFSGSMTLDVTGGFATSGTGVFTGNTFSNAAMVLITTATPGNETAGGPSFPVGFRDNGGTDLFGFDNVVPIDAAGGLLFDVGTTTAAWGQYALFGLWDGGSVFSGRTVTGAYDYVDFGTEAVSPTPEPATWAMMVLGIGGLGLAMRKRRMNGAVATTA